MNLFHYLSYEGAVDIESITDPLEKESVIATINNFGQTPRQLFKKPHPKRQFSNLPFKCQLIDFMSSLKESSVLSVAQSAVHSISFDKKKVTGYSCFQVLYLKPFINTRLCLNHLITY